MASIHQFPKPSLLLVLLVILLSTLPIPSESTGAIAVYWGQDLTEGSLAAACATGNYKYVNVAFLNQFGNGRTPVLNLAGHCTPSIRGSCSMVNQDVITCKNKGVKVFLSLGGRIGDYDFSSADDATQVANFIWNNFLGGTSATRPIGDAVFDGVDFDIEKGTGLYYDTLANALRAKGNVLLSAAPQCIYPDRILGSTIAAIKFDYVWVQFYNNRGCDYTVGVIPMVQVWRLWAGINAGQVFMGLPASSDVKDAGSGYVPPDVLTEQVLTQIKTLGKYGGIMLWSRLYDTGYSDAIKSAL